MKHLFFILFALIPFCNSFAQTPDDDIVPIDQLLARDADHTVCATTVFADALAAALHDVPEDTPEEQIQGIIYKTFENKSVLEQVLICPEITSIAEDDTVKFQTIEYTFPGGRKVSINYETQPKVLKQRILLADKHAMDAPDASPRIGDLDDPTVWTNTDPAWYGILVVQAGSLDEYVGTGHNQTISLKYLEQNIDRFYPNGASNGGWCTSRSALSNDEENINKSTKITVGLEAAGQEDTNDYYVAGDVNLQWISYAEIALDVVITVVTFGGGAVIAGITKGARAARVMRNLSTTIRTLAKTEKVGEYIRLSNKMSKITTKVAKLKKSFNPKLVDKYLDAQKKVQKLLKGKTRPRTTIVDKDLERAEQHLAKLRDPKKIKEQQKRVDELRKQAQALDDLALNPENEEALKVFNNASKNARKSMREVVDNPILANDPEAMKAMKEWQTLAKENPELARQITPDLAENTDDIAKAMRDMEKADKDVKKYKEATKTFEDLQKYRRNLRGLRRGAPHRGNIAVRVFKAVKAANSGGKKIEKGAKLARSSKVSTRLKDWLFDSTMKNIGKLGKLEETGGIIYGILKFGGEMYDWAETSTGEFTSGVEFKPLCLLSADDLPDQENVVNYGMWLLWQGDSVSAADDDAAYLQAMDFANKFASDLNKYQTDKNDYSCNVDVYVVRPIIREPDSENPEMYYLIMNDKPWHVGPGQ